MKKIFKQIKKYALTMAFVTVILTGSTDAVQISAAQTWPEPPGINAPSAILIEASTGSILYEKDAKRAMYPASTTKIMTALLAIENSRLTETVTMSYDATHSMGWDASRVGLDEGEQLSMEDALYAILLASANEVTYAVGEHIAGGDIEKFAEMMNKRAGELGCVNTHFVNPHGLHDDDHYTCAYDLALMMKKCIEYPIFSSISNNYNYTLPPSKKNEPRPIAQTHKILHRDIKYDGVFAGKTGYTDEAGNCLVTAAKRNGLTLICVVLKEEKNALSYTDTVSLFDYGFDNFERVSLIPTEDRVNAFPILLKDEEAFVKKKKSELTISETHIILPVGVTAKEVTNDYTLTQLPEFQKGDNVIGNVGYSYAGRSVGKADIIYHSDDDRIIDMAELYLREYKGTDEYDERLYSILAGTYVEEEVKKPDFRPQIIAYSAASIVLFIGIVIMGKMYLRIRI